MPKAKASTAYPTLAGRTTRSQSSGSVVSVAPAVTSGATQQQASLTALPPSAVTSGTTPQASLTVPPSAVTSGATQQALSKSFLRFPRFFRRKVSVVPSASLEEEEENLLRSLADPSLPEVFQFPELKGIILKFGTPNTHNTKQYNITFPSEKEASEFESRLKEKCLFDGKKVLTDGDTATLTTDKKVLTLDFINPGNTESIKKLCNRLKDSKNTYESNKEFEKELDTSIKKVAALALNIGGLLPIIPLASCLLGKCCQECHARTGLGSTFARTFLQIAKLGLKNSHLYSTDPGSTCGDYLESTNKWLNEIDQREKLDAKSSRRFTHLITGTIGAISNALSMGCNYIGDGLDTLAERVNIFARDGYYSKTAYCLSALLLTIAIPFKASGMILRSAGSILSADAILIADNKNKFADFGKWLRRFDNFIIETRLAPEKASLKINGVEKKEFITTLKDKKVEQILDEDLAKIRETAFSLFKEITGPSFQKSGIKGDGNEYCEVAKVKLKNNSYILLFSPINGDISIVEPRKDLNLKEEKNQWNSCIEEGTERADFTKLVLSLVAKPDKTKLNNIKGSSAKVSGHQFGLTSEQFQKKKTETEKDATKAIDGLGFKYNYNQYEYKKSPDGKTTSLYRQGATKKDLTAVNELEEFKIINDLYKTHGKKILEGRSPSTIVSHPFAETLKAIKTVQNDR